MTTPRDEPDPRHALRELMSELSEDAYCAAWHPDTEYRLWEILKGERSAWMALAVADQRIAELRRLHLATGGWWRWNPELDGGWGDQEFVSAADWERLYAATVDDKERHLFAVIDGKPLRGADALKATSDLLGPLLRKKEP